MPRPQYPDYTDIKLSFEQDNKIAIVTLNRPSRRNAWTPEMATELADVYAKLDEDDAVHAVMLVS
jgi:enoyl-CoA hydratase/carnithine racemase